MIGLPGVLCGMLGLGGLFMHLMAEEWRIGSEAERFYGYHWLAQVSTFGDTELGLIEDCGHLMMAYAEWMRPEFLLSIQRAACEEIARRERMRDGRAPMSPTALDVAFLRSATLYMRARLAADRQWAELGELLIAAAREPTRENVRDAYDAEFELTGDCEASVVIGEAVGYDDDDGALE